MPDARITLSVDNADLAVALVEKVGDAITRAGDASVSASAQSDDAFKAWASTTSDTLHPALEAVVPALSFMKDGLEAVGTEIKDLGDKVTEGLEHPLDTVKEAAKGVLEELGPLGVGITAVATAASAAGAAVFELAEHAAEAGESQLQFSRVTGESIEKVGGLSAAATIAGGSLDGMQSMLTQMQRRLDATGPAADKLNAGLADLGINAEAFRAADPTERIAMLAEGMQASAGKTTLMSDALAVMGRSGVQNIGFLMEYTDEAREKGEALGLTLSQTEAQGAVELGIATRTTGVELSTMANTIGVQLIPATTVAVEGFNRTILALEHIADLGGLVSGGWHLITGAVGETAAAEQTAGAVQDDVNRKWADAAARGLDLSAATYDVADKMLKAGYSVQTVAEQIGLSTEEVKGLAKAMKDASSAGDAYVDVWQKIADAEAEAGRVDAPLSASVKGQILDYQALGLSVQEIATALHISTGEVTAAEEAHTKAAAAVDKHRAAVDAIKASLEGDSKATQNQIEALDQLIAAGITDEDVKTRAVELITKLEEKNISLTDGIYKWDEANRQNLDSTKMLGVFVGELSDRSSDASDWLYNLSSSTNEFHDGITIAGDEISTVTIPLFSTLARDILPQMSGAIQDATRDTASFADELSGSLDQALQSMPNVLVKAVTGNGGLAGAASAVGSKFGADLGKSILGKAGDGGVADELTDHFGDAIGGALGAAIPAVGALIGPLIGMLFSIGGPSAAELAGRKTEAAFEEGFGGFAGMMDTVGKAYATAGLSATQAQADVKALLDAETQGTAATQAAIDRINGVIATSTANVSTSVGGILDSAKMVGLNFPAAMQPVIAQLAALPGLTDAEKNSLLGLANAGQPSFNDLTSAAGRYGLSLDSIGGKAAQLSISTQADQIESDYKTLVTTSGADSDKVLAGMKTSLNDLVNHAMDAGDVLPTALQPLINQLFNTGQLTDDAGGKITDLSKLKFDDTGDPLATGMKSLTDAINHLGDLLSPGGLPKTAADAAAAIGGSLGGIKAPEIALHYQYVADNAAPDNASYAAQGYVGRGVQYMAVGGFPGTPSGPDNIPIWMNDREAVLNPTATATLGRDAISALNRGGASFATSDAATSALHAELVGLRADNRQLHDTMKSTLATLPMMMRHALRGAR